MVMLFQHKDRTVLGQNIFPIIYNHGISIHISSRFFLFIVIPGNSPKIWLHEPPDILPSSHSNLLVVTFTRTFNALISFRRMAGNPNLNTKIVYSLNYESLLWLGHRATKSFIFINLFHNNNFK